MIDWPFLCLRCLRRGACGSRGRDRSGRRPGRHWRSDPAWMRCTCCRFTASLLCRFTALAGGARVASDAV